MKTSLRITVASAFLLLCLTSVVSAAPKSETATIGWFLKEVAAARGLSVASEADAAPALRAAGIALPALDPAKTLTEGDVVTIGSAMGVPVTSKSPGATFDRARARSFVASFGAELGSGEDGPNTPTDEGGTPNDNSNNGKGKKKGHNKSSSEPF